MRHIVLQIILFLFLILVILVILIMLVITWIFRFIAVFRLRIGK
jgi:hypothetical protein